MAHALESRKTFLTRKNATVRPSDTPQSYDRYPMLAEAGAARMQGVARSHESLWLWTGAAFTAIGAALMGMVVSVIFIDATSKSSTPGKPASAVSNLTR